MAIYAIDEQYSKPSTEGDLTSAAHASFFLLPSGGGEERERENKKQTKSKATNSSLTLFRHQWQKPWVYLQSF